MIEIAKKYIEYGLSVSLDKKPVFEKLPPVKDKNGYMVFNKAGNFKHSWKPFQSRIPDITELESLFYDVEGIAIVGGKVSKGLEIIDVDVKNDENQDIWVQFKELLVSRLPELFPKLVIETTQNKGFHIYYRTKTVSGCKILAHNQNNRPLIELRGEGSYNCCAPTKGYKLIQGDFENIPIINQEFQKRIIDIAKSLDRKHNISVKNQPILQKNHPDIYDVRSALKVFPRRPDYDVWLKLISALANTYPDVTVIQLVAEFFPEEKHGEIKEKINNKLDNITIGTLFLLAQNHGYMKKSENPYEPNINKTIEDSNKDVVHISNAADLFKKDIIKAQEKEMR